MSKQLLRDIPELVSASVISEETAGKIIGYYESKKRDEPNNLVMILGVLGALLVGGGIVLIVAHNWDELSRSVKTMLSFLPLLLAQLLCVYTLIKQKQSRLWRESSSVLLFFAVVVSISLISQVYQVNGPMSSLLLTWMLLTLPLVYLLSSSTVALLCIGGITWFGCEQGYFDRPSRVPFMYAVMMLALVPFYLNHYRLRPAGNTLHITNWLGAISLTICLGAFVQVQTNVSEWTFLLYSLLFSIFYLIGRSSFFKDSKLRANPFLCIGITGTLAIFLAWSFWYTWKGLVQSVRPSTLFNDPLPYLILAGLCILVYLTIRIFRHKSYDRSDPTGFSALVFLFLLVAFRSQPLISTFIINGWILFMAIHFIRKGSRENHLGILNFGLIILASLAICRFFDDTIPFIWRGLFFVATGAGFFAANYWIIKKRKQLSKP
jgi:uncharacterized membrane protein